MKSRFITFQREGKKTRSSFLFYFFKATPKYVKIGYFAFYSFLNYTEYMSLLCDRFNICYVYQSFSAFH